MDFYKDAKEVFEKNKYVFDATELAKHDAKIRADAIDEIAKIIIPITKCKEGCKAMEIECSHCMAEKLDNIETQINCFLEQLKEKG